MSGVGTLHTSVNALSRRLYLKLALTSRKLNGSQTTRSYELLGPCCPEQLDDDIPAVWSIPRQGRTYDQLHGRPHYARQHLRVASDRMKACYDHLAKAAGLQEVDQVWWHQSRGKSIMVQQSLEGSCNVITWINYVAYRIPVSSQGEDDGGPPG